MNEILAYYATHSPISDPDPYAYLYDDLPDDLEQLFQIINGVLVHKFDADDLYQPTSIQRKEQFLRTMQQRLARIIELDPSSLTVPREMKEKQIGYCREYAVFMTSILRHKGYAARTRAGFGEYFVRNPAYKGDHWLTEYWDAGQGRWRLVDADIGGSDLARLEEKAKAPLKSDLDFSDVRAGDAFHLAPDAWLRCRSGEERIDLFRHNAHWRGWPMLRGNLLHDFQALNKLEMGLFDYWDDLHLKPESAMTARDKALLDQIARLTLEPEATFDEMRALFEELPRTRVIRSRLHLLGIGGGGQGQMAAANDLRGSDADRLTALTTSHDGPVVSPAGDVQVEPGRVEPRDRVAVDLDASRYIIVLGARQNNLKNIDVQIPRNKLVVITGVSGSGKSSLAFDTIYAEGQRRYIESLSSFARHFAKQMDKPLVDQVIGLNPAVAIDQRAINPNSRSTVGSLTEVIDYLRLLFARLGQMHCPQCGRAVKPQSAQQIANALVELPPGTPFQVLGDSRSGAGAQGEGRTELLVAELVVPGMVNDRERNTFHAQAVDAVDRAFEVGKGIVILGIDGETLRLSEQNACPECALHLPRLEPRLLNANTIFGMCNECHGLGLELQVDPELIITKPHRSLLEDASAFYPYRNLRKSSSQYWVNFIRGIADYYGADLEKPWNELPEDFRRALIYGSKEEIHIEFGTETESGSFRAERTRQIPGAIHHINRLYRQTKSENARRQYMQFMRRMPCPACNGERLNREARFVTLAGRRFPEVSDLSIGALLAWIRSLKPGLNEQQLQIGEELLAGIEERLQFICDVGLHYLSLGRPAPTLSGGEAQRIRLASQIGSELVGVLYVLDEPSIGLHSRDQMALIGLLKHLRDLGNTVLVVEHDAETMREADWLIDLGPGAGELGGELVAAGTPQEVMAQAESLTGQYLAGKLAVRAPDRDRLRAPRGWLTLKGARLHNLKGIDARFPLGTFICITGVSGSGKSSLITQTLSPALARALHDARELPGPHDGLEGAEQIDRVIHITQAPIGLNPRSNPATYVGVWDEVRKIFARTEQAKALGYGRSHFSFNTKAGRCEACDGYGANKVKMHFMADVWVRCQVCEGKRFTPQTLGIRYRGLNIADILDMDVQQAFEFFADQPRIEPMLRTLLDVGLGYVKLGQSAPTLSGGEAQRIKLARELSRRVIGHILYILDEPTTGLHFVDIQNLLDILHRLVDAGHTVMVIEHNLDVCRTADWIVDLGPEGGEDGGYIVAEGTPAEIAAVEASYTGQSLK
ncbi:MAG: excinuclease ABC subunit UvrA [Anaerolineae bacterium]